MPLPTLFPCLCLIKFSLPCQAYVKAYFFYEESSTPIPSPRLGILFSLLLLKFPCMSVTAYRILFCIYFMFVSVSLQIVRFYRTGAQSYLSFIPNGENIASSIIICAPEILLEFLSTSIHSSLKHETSPIAAMRSHRQTPPEPLKV